MKYTLTDVSIDFMWKKLFQIKATKSFWNVKEWELWWYIEKEDNLSQDGNAWVYGDARVYGDAWVSGNAFVSAKLAYKKGFFIWWDDTGKITKLTHEQVWNTYCSSNYVLWDYEITEIEWENMKEEVIEELTLEEVCKQLGKNIKIVK